MYAKIQNLDTEVNQERKVCVLGAVFFPSDLNLNTILKDTSVKMLPLKVHLIQLKEEAVTYTISPVCLTMNLVDSDSGTLIMFSGRRQKDYSQPFTRRITSKL